MGYWSDEDARKRPTDGLTNTTPGPVAFVAAAAVVIAALILAFDGGCHRQTPPRGEVDFAPAERVADLDGPRATTIIRRSERNEVAYLHAREKYTARITVDAVEAPDKVVGRLKDYPSVGVGFRMERGIESLVTGKEATLYGTATGGFYLNDPATDDRRFVTFTGGVVLDAPKPGG